MPRSLMTFGRVLRILVGFVVGDLGVYAAIDDFASCRTATTSNAK